MKTCTSGPSLSRRNVDTARGREGVGGGEQALILVFLLLNYVIEFFSSLPCRYLEVGADTKVDDSEIDGGHS